MVGAFLVAVVQAVHLREQEPCGQRGDEEPDLGKGSVAADHGVAVEDHLGDTERREDADRVRDDERPTNDPPATVSASVPPCLDQVPRAVVEHERGPALERAVDGDVGCRGAGAAQFRAIDALHARFPRSEARAEACGSSMLPSFSPSSDASSGAGRDAPYP